MMHEVNEMYNDKGGKSDTAHMLKMINDLSLSSPKLTPII
jgi:hypothetical protein